MCVYMAVETQLNCAGWAASVFLVVTSTDL